MGMSSTGRTIKLPRGRVKRAQGRFHPLPPGDRARSPEGLPRQHIHLPPPEPRVRLREPRLRQRGVLPRGESVAHRAHAQLRRGRPRRAALEEREGAMGQCRAEPGREHASRGAATDDDVVSLVGVSVGHGGAGWGAGAGRAGWSGSCGAAAVRIQSFGGSAAAGDGHRKQAEQHPYKAMQETCLRGPSSGGGVEAGVE